MSTPALTKDYMGPTMSVASPSENTWHADMADAMTKTMNNFFGALKFIWSGTVTAGVYVSPLAGNGGFVCEKIVVTEAEVISATANDTPVVGLFTLLSKKLSQPFNIMLGNGVGSACDVMVFDPQPILFAGTQALIAAGSIARAEMATPIQEYQDEKEKFYNVMDRNLASALNQTQTVIACQGLAVGGYFTGTCTVIPNVKA